MKIIVKLFILQILLSFNLFSLEFDSYYQKNYHYFMVGKNNAKIGFNFSYSNLIMDFDKNVSFQTIAFGGNQKTSFGPSAITMNYIPYQPVTSGLSIIYGITDNFQIFFSGNIYEKYYYSHNSEYFEEYEEDISKKYVKSTIVDKFGTPFLGFSLNISFRNSFLIISPYFSLPFYQETKNTTVLLKNNSDISFEQGIGIGLYLNYNKYYENLFFDFIFNFYIQNKTDNFSNYNEYNFGTYIGYVVNEDIDIIKIGLIAQKKYVDIYGIYKENFETMLKFDMILSLNLFTDYCLNMEYWHLLPTDKIHTFSNYGLGLQIEYKF